MASKTPAASLIQVPARFSIVEQGVYRCASPTGPQVCCAVRLGCIMLTDRLRFCRVWGCARLSA